MAKFYNSNVTASVCGRPVRVSHSMSYPTIQVSSRGRPIPQEQRSSDAFMIHDKHLSSALRLNTSLHDAFKDYRELVLLPLGANVYLTSSL